MSDILPTVAIPAPDSAPAGTSPRMVAARLWAQRGVVVALVLTAVVAFRWYQVSTGLGPTGIAQDFIDAADSAWWGILAYVGVYLARPIVLFPASVLTVVAGILFGPVVGIAVVVVAANASALIAYWIGRSLGRRPEADEANGSVVRRWSGRMRENGFESVLLMRLLFLPYDLVNYLSGILRIPWFAFLAATVLGSLPGTVSFVLLGASIERVDEGLAGIDRVALAAGFALFAASLAGARLLRRRGVGPGTDTATGGAA